MLHFKTIYKKGTAEITEKKSRFIGSAFPVNTENQAIEYIAQVKKLHPKANHNCFAYQIGQNNEYIKQSDNGEPYGTAGMPILDVLRKLELRDTLIVVTRYFGGTLLGTGGLVRSYGLCAKQAATKGVIIEKMLYNKLSIKCNYSLSSKVQYEILTNDYTLQNTIYTDIVEYIVFVPFVLTDKFIKNIINICSNTATINILNEAYAAFIDTEIIIF